MEDQLHSGSEPNNNSPNYLLAAHQSLTILGPADKANIFAIFDHVDNIKHFVKKDDIKFPKDSVEVEYATFDYLNQYRELELFWWRL